MDQTSIWSLTYQLCQFHPSNFKIKTILSICFIAFDNGVDESSYEASKTFNGESSKDENHEIDFYFESWSQIDLTQLNFTHYKNLIQCSSA